MNEQFDLSAALLEQHNLKTFTLLSRRGNIVDGQGSRLLQLDRLELGELYGVFVEFPVDISIQFNENDVAVNVSEIKNEDVEEAVTSILRLVRKGQINTDPEAISSQCNSWN